jgi:hypothetical protein
MSARPSLAQQWQANAHQAIDSERAAHNLLQIIEAHRDYRRLWMKSARDARGFLESLHTFVARARQCNHLVIRARKRLREISGDGVRAA